MSRSILAFVVAFSIAAAGFVCPLPALSSTCTVTTASVSLGAVYINYGASQSGTISGSEGLSCTTASVPVMIGIGYGMYPSGTQRRMYGASCPDYISYNFYQDAGHTMIWDDVTNLEAVTSSATANTTTYQNIYWVIPQFDGVCAGNYTDKPLWDVHF